MVIYTIESIHEADYGCEENTDGIERAVLKLVSDDAADETFFEMTEKEIADKGLSEGKKAVFDPEGRLLKYVRVTAAVVKGEKDGKECIFATARGYGEFKGWWEFPGGKIENGETPEQALVREIKEELDADIAVGDLIKTIEYDYPSFHLSMDCFWARLVSGGFVLKEAEAARWLGKEELEDVKWLPADLELIERIKEQLS